MPRQDQKSLRLNLRLSPGELRDFRKLAGEWAKGQRAKGIRLPVGGMMVRYFRFLVWREMERRKAARED